MNDERPTDEYLLAKIAGREPQALATFYDRYAAAVLAVALLVVRNAERAEEVMVDTFWAVWQQNGVLPIEGTTIRNRLMLYTRRVAQEYEQQLPAASQH